MTGRHGEPLLVGSGAGRPASTTVLVTNLTLAIPVTRQAGPYGGSLTISAVTAIPERRQDSTGSAPTSVLDTAR